MSTTQKAKKARDRWLLIVLAPIWIPIVVVVLLFLPAFGLVLWVRGVMLRRRFRSKWAQSGKDILLIYSNSPNWQEYIEENWLPWIQERAVVINWSERANWSATAPLESKVFRHFAGKEEFNPSAIHLPKSGPVKVIRFWQAFRDFKHGKDALLRRNEEELRMVAGAEN